jgi:hypothetical protein
MNMQNNQNVDQYGESESVVLDLEALSMRYSNLLNEYQYAVSNYINYLQQEASTPCGSYTGSSTNVSESCYMDIWSKAGCTTGNRDPAGVWWPKQTMNTLIQNSWDSATGTDYNSRMNCYGNPGNPYIILCVGTDGNLWSRQGLEAPWQKVNDNSNGNLRSICTGNDGKTIYASTNANSIWTKTSWNASSWNTLPNTNNCCVMSLAQGQNGTYVGVGMNNVLWSNTNNMFSGGWSQTSSPGEWVSAVAIGLDGSVFVVGGGNNVWKKNSYLNLPSQQWQFQPNACCVKAMTIAPDGTFIGVGTDDQLYTKASFTDLSTPWTGPHSSENGSCCAISITTVANPNYNSSNYNQTSQPNYNIQAQPLVTVNNSAYWGTSGVGQINSTTLQECQATCSSTNGCTGATFNSGTCFLRGGNSTLTAASDTEVAILPKGQQLLSIIQNIDIQLTEINTQIQDKTNNGQPLYETQTQERRSQTQNLISQFIQLTEERNKLDEMVGEYQTLDKEQIEGDIMINQNYYSFILLVALAIIIIIVLYFFNGSSTSAPISNSQPILQTGGKLGRNAYYLVFGIILLMFITNYSFKKLMN